MYFVGPGGDSLSFNIKLYGKELTLLNSISLFLSSSLYVWNVGSYIWAMHFGKTAAICTDDVMILSAWMKLFLSVNDQMLSHIHKSILKFLFSFSSVKNVKRQCTSTCLYWPVELKFLERHFRYQSEGF